MHPSLRAHLTKLVHGSGTLSYLAPADAASGAPWQSIEQVSAAANPLIALYPSHDARWYSTSAGKLEPASSDTDAAGEEFSSESLDAMAAFCQAEEMRSSIEAAPDHSGSGRRAVSKHVVSENQC